MDSIKIIHFNGRSALNLMSKKCIEELNQDLYAAENDPAIRVIVILPVGDHFSCGADLAEVVHHAHPQDPDFIKEWEYLSTLSKPVIVGIKGYVLGGGFELALMGDILIAAQDTQIRLPELSVGLIPGGGATYRHTKKIGDQKTKHLCWTGQTLTAQKALDWGIVLDVVETRDLEHRCVDYATKISQHTQEQLCAIKKSVSFAQDPHTASTAIAYERTLFYEILTHPQTHKTITRFLSRSKKT